MNTQKGRYTRHYEVRDELVDRLRRELLGPDGPGHPDGEEILTEDAPVTRYPTGVLFPRPAASRSGTLPDGEPDPQVDDNVAELRGKAADDNPEDAPSSAAGQRRPSTMGVTFAVDPALASRIVVIARGARYEPTDAGGRRVAAGRAEARTTEAQVEHWRRHELDLAPVEVDTTKPDPKTRTDLADGLELDVRVRRASPETGTVTITATLVNTRTVDERDLADAHAVFQAGLTVRAVDDASCFVERPAVHGADDPDVRTNRLLYRHVPTFAVGHGCAAEWDWQPPQIGLADVEGAAVDEIRTEFVPSHEVLLTESNPNIDASALGMIGLAHGSEADVVDALSRLVDGYEHWITDRRNDAKALESTVHGRAAHARIEDCDEVLKRMRAGIALLAEKPDVLRAFQLANEAMAAQRARSAWIKDDRGGEPNLAEARWRPFQIAFVLLCLAGIDDPEHPDRSVSDLLWFPTGGGKTEAYLGLIAFTTFLRRLRLGQRGGGVAVLMRYTLRLLTLQQFERAAILICAMEELRRRNPDALGTEEISIGMWVGKSATPNTLETAKSRLRKTSGGQILQTENPVQLARCPWCGTGLDHHAYEVDETAVRMNIHCPNASCDFRDGLPVHVVDDAVYAARPTLVIATVDKFASMPWRPRTAALFNRDRQDGTPPPELIVQDELHLISGPLGTLTGLYETAVDALADRPKVIASTATIRRAADQGRRLFDRSVQQFPPAGLDGRDSWFAVETSRELKAARRYVGLFAPGTSQAVLLIRTYAALLHQAMRADCPDDVRDAYWTLVGFFNSLRLLSAAELQVHDDVVGQLKVLARADDCEPRDSSGYAELTSRVDASDIPRLLKQIEKSLPHSDTVDVLLATNMIAVGVDIDRLGLMAVMGQPQTTAEYIQATSRVGRQWPGLVAVMLNAARSRDRSHYENFTHFHSALYREVESTSVTPFSARARDRGLHAVVVALTRLTIKEAADNTAAGRIDRFVHRIRTEVKPLITARVHNVGCEEEKATDLAVEDFLDWWEEEAELYPNLTYEPQRGRPGRSLLAPFDDRAEGSEAWETLWSLRDVDAESKLFLESHTTTPVGSANTTTTDATEPEASA
ncbi:helicase-related protein [Streptomyces iconiensis]|uniref:Helicase-related protein n=1 Tax=Streptomyces iconiensis TaxID=1384038 RepID=A0ABT6ZZK4_9ACTN|nr:helicase-related protein [Streptomyces iconiensis]MDJ1134507.1 helicase-related protein [Streptomyces iconiensis]